jgi:hypothetical protein
MNQCSQSFSQIATKKDLDSIPEFSRSDSIPLSKNRNNGTLNFPFQDASSRLIHQVCMNRRLLSSSDCLLWIGILVTISQDFLFSVAVLQLGRVWLSARRAIPSFPSMHLPRVSHSVISTETSVQVGAIK